jgi:hypothetical protein
MSAFLHATTFVEAGDIRLRTAWTNGGDGVHCADIGLGDGHSITLHQPDEADALIKAATDAKAALLRLAAEAEAAREPEDGDA